MGQDNPLVLRIAQQSDDFRMIPISDNDRGVSFLSIFFDNGLDLNHPWTSGVHYSTAVLSQSFVVLRGDAVSPDNDRTGLLILIGVQDMDPFLFEHR